MNPLRRTSLPPSLSLPRRSIHAKEGFGQTARCTLMPRSGRSGAASFRRVGGESMRSTSAEIEAELSAHELGLPIGLNLFDGLVGHVLVDHLEH